MNPTPESLHNGKYILNSLLAQGIFGITYKATDADSGQSVVLKTLSDSLRHHPNFERFKQKFLVSARRLARCSHPNLVRVIGCFEDAGRPYLVMEYIPGQTLAQIIQADKPLPIPQAIHYIRQIGAALIVLHQKKLLHRDVRPQNIIRRQDTFMVVLTDFGIACDLTQGVRQTHACLLSAGYAPPEYYLSSCNSTPATDVYSLSATLYYLLLGRPPVPASVRDAEALHRQRERLPELQQFEPNLGSTTMSAIIRGLEIDAQLRPQTIEAWLDLLPVTQFPKQNLERDNLREPIPTFSSKVTQPEPPALPPPRPPVTTQDGNKQIIDTTAGSIVNGWLNKYVLPVKSALSLPSKDKAPTRYPQVEKVLKWGLSIANLGGERVSGLLENAVRRKAPPSGSPGTQVKDKDNDKKKFPRRELALTSAIALVAGVSLGLTFRFNHPNEPGSTIFHTEQSFPPSNDWPVSDSPDMPKSTTIPSPSTDTSLPTTR